MTDQSPNTRLERARPLWVIIAALTIWGLYLAVGATGAFTPGAGFFDVRKFFVVAIFSAAFLLFWFGNLRLAKLRKSGQLAETRISVSSWLALGMSLTAYGLWGTAYALGEKLAIGFGLVAALLFGCSMIAAMVGVSDRIPKKGKSAGLLAAVLFLLAIGLFILQVNAFVRR